MPRKEDPLLEARIVGVARVLCVREGASAVTMRAVALLAKTSTPTLYQRFVDRQALLEALRKHTRAALAREMFHAASPDDACKRYLKFAVRHAHEYELLTSAKKVAGEPQPRGELFDAVQSRLAQIFGGTPEDFDGLAVQLWCLVHGTASLLIARGKVGLAADELREECRKACQAVVERTLLNRKKGTRSARRSR